MCLAKLFKSRPIPEEIEKGHFMDRFILVVVTDWKPEKIKESLLNVGEVIDVRVEDFVPRIFFGSIYWE